MAEPAPDDDFAVCETCGADLDWVDCWDCGSDGVTHHDCGEDTCCCLEPEDNVPCQICDGKGGWLVCPRADAHHTEAAKAHG